MKKNIILLILVLNNYLAFTQHPDLQNTDWYVQSITINGNTTDIPNEPIYFPYVSINFYNISSGFIASSNPNTNPITDTTICEKGFTAHLNYINNDTFTFQDINLVNSDNDCNSDIQNFMNLYTPFFNNNISYQFTYTILTDTENIKILTITNNNGETIIYRNSIFTTPPIELSNTWYLYDLVLDNIHYQVSDYPELDTIPLDFSYLVDTPEFFTTRVCDEITAFQDFNISFETFYLYNTSIGISCSFEYQNNYFNFFTNNLPGPFSYLLTEDNSTLTISIPNGDYAVYSNQVGATSDFSYNNIKMFPNPTKNTLNFQATEKLNSIIITDMQGRIIIEKSFNDYNTSIDLSNIEKGIYFANIYDTNNKLRKTEKVIKE